MENAREDINPEEGLNPTPETPDDEILGDCEVDDTQPVQAIPKARIASLLEELALLEG